MLQFQKVSLLGLLVVGLLVAGCQEQTLRCAYQVGDVEKVRYTGERLYKSWLEMPGKDPQDVGTNRTQEELVMVREVQSVEPDGSAMMKVTLESVRIELSGKDESSAKKYLSSAEGTTSWGDEPALAGMSYTIHIAPDTRVLEVKGLAELRQKAGIKDSDSGVIARMLDEERIKRYHERDFVIYSPKTLDVKKGYDSEMLPLPDVMIKATAIKKHYEGTVEGDQIHVSGRGEAVQGTVEGFEEPKINQFGQAIIKQQSDMQKLDITDDGIFSISQGKVLKDNKDVACSLVLLEENLFGGQAGANAKDKKEWGVMYTDVQLKSNFEVIP
jgi:hypothetical protein